MKPPASLENRVQTRCSARRAQWLWLVLGLTFSVQPLGWGNPQSWPQAMLRARAKVEARHLSEEQHKDAAWQAWLELKNDYPMQWDWTLQDGTLEFQKWFHQSSGTKLERDLIRKVIAELGSSGLHFRTQLEELIGSTTSPQSPEWLSLYEAACHERRATRLKAAKLLTPRIVYTQSRTLRPSFFAYTEGQSDAQNERHFSPGSELCLLDLAVPFGESKRLVLDPTGAIRDPAVSPDGKRVVFAWKKSLDDDDYHLYELEFAGGTVKQLTSGKGFADYEPAYLPNGDLIFASTRCVQTVDCWWTEVSNLYTCDPQGRRLRRLTFDQVHSIYPQVLEDGRVIYTRWDYNDRGQIFPQALFQMFPDGTGQTEFYGNNSWFPTVIVHARGIPGTQKVLAVLCGHHTSQAGKLAIIDPAKGRQENAGVQLVAPARDTPAERVDGYGQEGELWQYPYPINENEFLCAFAPLGWGRPAGRRDDADFGIYWMDIDGRRELLAWDPKWPCHQPVAAVARPGGDTWQSRVDFTKDQGTYYLQDIYEGPGLFNVPRGTVKKLRVVALEFRAAGVGQNGSAGPGGAALVSTPVSVGNGTWDVKVILGDATVHADGSAMFTVPARTPVYFQALDANGYAVQTMRSWSTLQPGEVSGCIGCHEHKNAAPGTRAARPNYSQAMEAGPEHLQPFYGPPRGFSFRKEVQPILDQHCIRCHSDQAVVKNWIENGFPTKTTTAGTRSATGRASPAKPAFSLLSSNILDSVAKRMWSVSYLA